MKINYLKSEEQEIKRAKEIDFDTMSKRQKRYITEKLADYGYVAIDVNSFYLHEMSNAIVDC